MVSATNDSARPVAPVLGPTGAPLTLVRAIELVPLAAQKPGHVAGFWQTITHTARYRCTDGVEGWMGFDGQEWLFPYWTKSTRARG